MSTEVRETISKLNAPLLYSFSEYVLNTARENNVRRIYFLARDGYEPYIFSKKIAAARGAELECRYLFASRLAWRLASYALLSESKTLELLFSPSQSMTPAMIWERVGATQAEKEFLTKLFWVCEDEVLTGSDLNAMRNAAARNSDFWRIVRKNSENALAITMQYFRQEKLTDGPFAVCDTGWSGSMQTCLETILKAQGAIGPKCGIYFGLYACPKKIKCRTRTYFFGPSDHFFRKAKFNNNLLEAMFVSPHGMTLGYCKEAGKVRPILKKERADWFLQDHKILQEWLNDRLERCDDVRTREIGKRLIGTMYKPGREELQCFSRYRFSDDPAEGHWESIVRKLTKREAKRFLVLNRLRVRFTRKGKRQLPSVYWLYGSIEASDLKFKCLYRWNCFVWEVMRLLRIAFRNKG